MSSIEGDFSAQPATVDPEEKKMWGVHAVTLFGRWLEEHTIAIGAIFMFIAVIAIGADMQLNNAVFGHFGVGPIVLSVILALAIESNTKALLRRTAKAVNEKPDNWLIKTIFFGLLGSVMVTVVVQMVWAWILMLSGGYTEATALAHIGSIFGVGADAMQETWTAERAIVFGVLFSLHAFIDYKPPKARAKTRGELEAEMRDEIALNPLRQQLARSRTELSKVRAEAAAQTGVAMRNAASSVIRGKQGDVVITGITTLDGPDDDEDNDPTPPTGPRGGGRPRSGRRAEAIDLSRFAERGETSGVLNMTTLRRRDAAAVNWMLEHGRSPSRDELRNHFIALGIPVPSTPATYDAIVERASAHLPQHASISVSRVG